jgi:hypothetical protein
MAAAFAAGDAVLARYNGHSHVGVIVSGPRMVQFRAAPGGLPPAAAPKYVVRFTRNAGGQVMVDGTRMTRAAWEARVAARQDRLGGDLWNTDQIWRRAFTAPEVVAASFDYLGTGLWCDVVLTLADGRRVTRRILG